MSFSKLSLKGRALRYLAQREHSRAELQTKLAPHVEEGEDLAAILDELEAKGFISAERFVDSVIHTKAARYGANRVLQELRHKGVDAELVAEARERLRSTELERARVVWQRRFGTPPDSPQERAKQMRFLAGRGFGGDVVRKVLRGTDEE
ncbi:recombination regulator RecX [Comamonas piscis]|uniref:Regulatory protein RecX n=1 Tax=Comamonas piscis TaxID=1562974 RepID=A0A7G5EDB7_9BURK|nr:recombination regulator RecX [Comamonas piscis]QMV71992.1 recombination regulator RecX [Comamonas piscis]WSO34737.1 recombination regulator RecX [Comamonas piscis]